MFLPLVEADVSYLIDGARGWKLVLERGTWTRMSENVTPCPRRVLPHSERPPHRLPSLVESDGERIAVETERKYMALLLFLPVLANAYIFGGGGLVLLIIVVVLLVR